jgi:hypothetical protein
MHESFYAKITLKPGKGKNKKNVSGNQKNKPLGASDWNHG